MSEQPAGSAVRVLVRCRPLLPREASGVTASLRIDHSASTIGVGLPNSPSETRFRFDGVADMTCTQEDVYALGRVGELVSSTLGGYNATIFAYGQTASGKTFTMEGFDYGRDRSNRPLADLRTDPRKLGIIPRAVDELFARAAAANEGGAHVRVRMSYFQLYREEIHDLLTTRTPADRAGAAGAGGRCGQGLRLRWAAGREFFVENLSEYEVADAAEALDLFRLGVGHKAMAETAMNAASSRSHAVLTLRVDSLEGSHGRPAHSGTLSLVDLAGSERQPKGVQRSAQLLDSAQINRSLFALRKVIVALSESKPAASEGGTRRAHVPYRDAVLTKVLKGSLGGSARTLMLACISCADEAADESLSTLAYAARARAITNVPVRNADPRLSELADLKGQVAELRAEVGRLTALLGEGGGAGADGGAPPALTPCGLCGARGGPPEDGTKMAQPAASVRPDSAVVAAASAGAGVDAAAHRRLGERFVQAVAALRAALLGEARLRAGCDALGAQAARAAAAHAQLAGEHERLAERLRMLEAVLTMEAYPDASWLRGTGEGGGGQAAAAGGGGGGSAAGELAAMLKRAVQEAIELRAENEQLRDWLGATPALPAPPPTPSASRAERAERPCGAGGPPRTGGVGGPAVHRLSSAGRLVPQHSLLLASERLAGPPPAAAPAPCAELPPPADTFTNLEQLAQLLRQRAALSRHASQAAAAAPSERAAS